MAAPIPYICAPNIAQVTLAAIIRVESGGNPLALHDNTTGRSYSPSAQAEASALLASLLRLGHSVDAGLMQVNSVHFPAFGLTADNVFNPCININVGGDILGAAWAKAKRAGLTGQTALWHALQVYNSGRLAGSPAYARRVWAAALKSSPAQLVMKTVGSAIRRSEVFAAAPDKNFAFAQSWVATNTWDRR